ncbi:hypothetical protein MA16_Dca006953 [Dendrobium catenatum]|uniref:Citrate transporter-like domain-containing protein n=1 Tax=Dendrobium catenatum TaxID=906689 RepID=A0A2I0VWX9_9ASPA|nr:hypothetical protein MA16_Dca006953 [Dendrobium catenatum]
MAMASMMKVVLGSIAFGFFWVLAVFPAVPFLPIGRTAGALLGAMLMVVFRVISPYEANEAIDLDILGLLFGTMVVSVYLERADMFKYLGKLLTWKSRGGKDLLFRVCLVSAISSALFTNDTCCILLTEFILKIARQNNLPPQPFLLALASSSNIGSAATPIGNPQNLVIAVQSKISFEKFLFGILPSMLLGVLVNGAILLCYFWKLLSIERDQEVEAEAGDLVVENEVINSHQSPHASSVNSRDFSFGIDVVTPSSLVNANSKDPPNENWKRFLWKICVYLVTIGMLVALFLGFNMSCTAVTAALALVVLDFKDARPCLEKVSYTLLVFFCGMFIAVHGFNKTGIPSTLWEAVERYSRIDSTGGIALLSVVILLLSNVASNVPTVLLLGSRVAASAASISATEEARAWLILAWVSTVAGNLSLLGSAANLIVCEQARRAQFYSYNLSFWSHLKFGVPSTIIVNAIGLPFIRSY